MIGEQKKSKKLQNGSFISLFFLCLLMTGHKMLKEIFDFDAKAEGKNRGWILT